MRENTRLLLVGRDDWQKDEALNLALLQQLKNNRIEIIWEDPAAPVIHFFRKIEQKYKIFSPRIKKCHLRLIQIVYGLLHPSYFVYLYKRKNNSVAFRCESLKKTIRKHGGAKRTIVLARSSGGRVASLIADELNLKQIVCLGYPFKHPEQDDEPARYAHLAQLKTPMLIIQGIRDVIWPRDFGHAVKLVFVVQMLPNLVIHKAMHSLTMVISFNIFEDRFSPLCTGFKLFTMKSFYFQRVEKALRTGIIVIFVTVQQDAFRGARTSAC